MILPRRIYDLGCRHKAVSVYCYLCKPCRQNGECYPSVGRIAEDLSLSTCTVFRAFNELEKRDLLERISRYHPQGGRRSSLYRIKGEITKTNRARNEVVRLFDWISDAIDWIGDGISSLWDSTVGSAVDAITDEIWDIMFNWLFNLIYGR